MEHKGSRGILTMAFGAAAYTRMATGLARSLRRHNPGETLAIVTDRPAQMARLFDVVVPVDQSRGHGLAQKLHLDRYSPFDETLFIDSDVLVFRNLAVAWERFRGTQGFGLLAHRLAPGEAHYAVENLPRFQEGAGISRMIMAHTGMLYFDRSPQAKKVFETVRALSARGDALGLRLHPAGFFNDEPLFGAALELLNLPFVSSEDCALMTLACAGTEGMRDLDIRKGRSRHELEGRIQEPAAIHFNVDSQHSEIYERELRRLELNAAKLSDRLADGVYKVERWGARFRRDPVWPLKAIARRIPFVRRRKPRGVEEVLDRLINEQFGDDAIVFVQVGANDGRQGDPLHEYISQRQNWSGLFIEPVPFVFERLRQNYGDSSRFKFENVAIGSARETRNFYYVGEEARATLGEDTPFWYDQLGSFDRDHIGRHLDGRLMPFVRSAAIDCVPLPEVLRRNGLDRVDLVQVDTEGFDYQVLSQLDLKASPPRIVLYEQKWLQSAERVKAMELLRHNGYRVIPCGDDVLAVRRGWRSIWQVVNRRFNS